MNEFIEKYYDLLTNEYKGINLTRITNFEEFKLKQIDDSIEPLKQSSQFKESIAKNKVMLDIGFGGGFPILPIAYLSPDIKFLGIDTRAKKAKVVQEISTKLDLNNVYLHHIRLENLLIDRKITCTLKAVGKVNDFLNKFNTTEIIQVFFYKGPNFYRIEKDQIEMAKNKWEIIEESEVNLPGVEKRYLIGFQNKKVPCGTVKAKSNLVKLSDIL